MTDKVGSPKKQGESPAVDYDADLKRLVCEHLERDLSEETTVARQSLNERQQRQGYGQIIIWIAGAVPLLILAFLGWQLMCQYSVIAKMDSTPKAIVISASILCFTIIYTVLIRGMFGNFQEKEGALPAREVLDAIKQQQGDS